MTLKELQKGDKFVTRNNRSFVCERMHEIIAGKRRLIVCKSPYGNVRMSPDLEVIKI